MTRVTRHLDSGLLPDAGNAWDAGADAGLDAGLPIADAGDDPHAPPALFSVEPASGGASVPTQVVLHGQGFGDVLWIQLGDDYATDVARRRIGQRRG
ncbi:MAG TPA: hypothetical protein DFS52_03845, partial [Myxococcales bacterium]|nr:hypothetical protein [Myxococcales bacterium]